MQLRKGGMPVAEEGKAARPPLSAAAQRALAEAGERRRLAASTPQVTTREVNGRDGPEPVRYGDWEVKGLASDF
jgi:hypothetical protein